MKCPECGEEMESGYVSVRSGYSATFNWSIKEEPFRLLGRRKKGTIIVMSCGPIITPGHEKKEKDWLRKGYRCKNCKLITFEY